MHKAFLESCFCILPVEIKLCTVNFLHVKIHVMFKLCKVPLLKTPMEVDFDEFLFLKKKNVLLKSM